MSEDVSVALITLVGVVFTAVLGLVAATRSKRAAKNARETNRAVNMVGEGEPRLYDMVKETNSQVHQIRVDVTSLRDDLTDHVHWELNQKFMTPSEIRAAIHYELQAWMEDRER